MKSLVCGCEEASSEEMVEKSMDISTPTATMLLLRTTRNTNKLTVKIEILKLYGDYVTYFNILLEQQDVLIEVQKEPATSFLLVVPSSLVVYIEKISSGTLNLIKELEK